MRQKPNIRWRDEDIKELDFYIKSFNSRLNWHRRKHGDADYLPDNIGRADVMKNIKTRADFNFTLSQLSNLKDGDEAFAPVTSEGGVTITKGELKAINNAQRRENIKRHHDRQRIKARELITGKQANANRLAQLEKREFDFMTADPEYALETVERINRMAMDSYADYRAEIYHDSLKTAMIRNFAEQDEHGNYNVSEELQRILDKVDSITPQELQLQVAEDDRKTVDYQYVAKFTQSDVMAHLREVWGVND